MEIAGDNLDDVLIAVYEALLKHGAENHGTRGDTLELLGVALCLKNPRARLSRSENRGKSLSALGELLWYLSKKKDVVFIEQYVPAYANEAEPDGTVNGGYGPRLFSMRDSIDQVQNVIDLLKSKPSSRRAVIQLFNAEDIAAQRKEVPCTTTIQFFLRDGQLHMAATLRSNDAYLGLPHDVFCFTMLQEMVASELGVNLGGYMQYVGSMHVYCKDIDNLSQYINEGHHRIEQMPSMPSGKAFEYGALLLECEKRMRAGENFDASTVLGESYWADLCRLLQAFWASGLSTRLDELIEEFSDPMYRVYAETRRKMKPKTFSESDV